MRSLLSYCDENKWRRVFQVVLLFSLSTAASEEAAVWRWQEVDLERPYYNGSMAKSSQGRVHRTLDCEKLRPWRWRWVKKQSTTIRALPLSGSELCELVRGNYVLFVGDSLSLEFVESWGLRRHEHCDGRLEAITLKNAVALTNKFVSADARLGECARAVRESPKKFGLQPLDFAERFELHKGATHVVFNAFVHLDVLVEALAGCYRQYLPPKPPEAALISARRDALRFWRGQIAEMAIFLGKFYANSKVYYRTSPPAGDPWLRGNHDARTSGQKRRASRPLRSSSEVDEAFGAWGAFNSEFSHDLYAHVNDMSIAAFTAAGHGVLDVETMLGARVDAHQASLDRPEKKKKEEARPGSGDAVHHCLPGAPDDVLDAILKTIFTGPAPNAGGLGNPF